MRLLEAYEAYFDIKNATCRPAPGETEYTVQLPSGLYAHAVLEPNQSTTIHIYNSEGRVVHSMNSGVHAACFILGAGTGIMLGSFTGNPVVIGAIGFFTSIGCNVAINHLNQDGDAYGQLPPC